MSFEGTPQEFTVEMMDFMEIEQTVKHGSPGCRHMTKEQDDDKIKDEPGCLA